VVAAVLATAAVAGPGCSRSAPEQSAGFKGVSWSPAGPSAEDLTRFLDQIGLAGGSVSWAGDFRELSQPDAGPHGVIKLAEQSGYQPVIIAGFFSGGPGADFRLLESLTGEVQARTVTSLRDFAASYHPPYLGVGLEVNTLAAMAPDEYQGLVALFAAAYPAIKQASPETQVFTVFQLETLKGLGGGLFGGANDPSLARWELLDDFAVADLVGFTTYPGLIYPDPTEIPADYYTDIRAHTAKPVAIVELGWPSDLGIAGWESTEEEQAAFVRRFGELIAGVEPVGVLWSFLYDQDIAEPFTSLGLIDRAGQAKAALADWQQLTL
jgi:hypothetical protein